MDDELVVEVDHVRAPDAGDRRHDPDVVQLAAERDDATVAGAAAGGERGRQRPPAGRVPADPRLSLGQELRRPGARCRVGRPGAGPSR